MKVKVQKGGYGDYGPRAAHYEQGRLLYPQWIFDQLTCRLPTYRAQEARVHALVADLGCGTGTGTRQLYNEGFTGVVGVDHDSRMIKIARKTMGVRRICDDGKKIKYYVHPVAKLPFPDDMFNLVTTFGGLVWFCGESGSMESIKRVLRPGGLFLAADEHHVYRSKRYDNIRSQYVSQERPPIVTEWNPQEMLGEQGFLDVTFTSRKEAEVLPVQLAHRYLLAASWLNLVPPKKLPIVENELYELCVSEQDSSGMVTWQFEFTATFGHKGSGVGL